MTTHIQTDLAAAADILQSNKIGETAVVDASNHLVGLITYKDITKAKDKSQWLARTKGRLRVAAGVGVTVDTLDRRVHSLRQEPMPSSSTPLTDIRNL